ncbi:small conductance mechanosensitive channel [Pseudoxanthomonas sp. GM95]|uniref:mechanosensitive ion channel family protein n=1 Tax=Pseudoxanthomonas sp. GM95 TaxID=1881043 RepID=UPI0008D3E917|nr:mechanosensitive ion channel domain-containing protein [Pseudoxanthomonas sp. GM95]SEL10933.1 small conductance mechanosensitive channel [Pseudoxanthomonas sp. GM95]
MENWWTAERQEQWTGIALGVGTRVLIGLVVLWIGLRLAKWLAGIATRGMTRAELEPTAVQFIARVLYVVLLVLLLLAILQSVFGVAPASLMAVVGAAGLAIGLALKDSLSNVASGVMLVTLKPFRVGDVVTLSGQTGKCESVSIFQTRLRGADNQTIILPNSVITSSEIINLTPDTRRRVELVIGIGYNDDIDKAKSLIGELLKGDTRILQEPAADVVVYALADNSVNLGVRCHVLNNDWFGVKCDLTENIKKAFDANGVSIPFPQRDVHVYHHLGTDGAAIPAAALTTVPVDALQSPPKTRDNEPGHNG